MKPPSIEEIQVIIIFSTILKKIERFDMENVLHFLSRYASKLESNQSLHLKTYVSCMHVTLKIEMFSRITACLYIILL